MIVSSGTGSCPIEPPFRSFIASYPSSMLVMADAQASKPNMLLVRRSEQTRGSVINLAFSKIGMVMESALDRSLFNGGAHPA